MGWDGMGWDGMCDGMMTRGYRGDTCYSTNCLEGFVCCGMLWQHVLGCKMSWGCVFTGPIGTWDQDIYLLKARKFQEVPEATRIRGTAVIAT